VSVIDDGGVSGATLERPALKRLLADIVGPQRFETSKFIADLPLGFVGKRVQAFQSGFT
jgi:hypothetical protein